MDFFKKSQSHSLEYRALCKIFLKKLIDMEARKIFDLLPFANLALGTLILALTLVIAGKSFIRWSSALSWRITMANSLSL